MPLSLVTALATLSACGCGPAINRTAAGRIRAALPTYIGPAREWHVRVDNPAERTLAGRLRLVVINGVDVQLRQTITCDTLRIELRDVSYDTLSSRLRSVGSTTFAATISEAHLNDYLRQFPPPDDEPVRVQRVQVREGAVYAEATRWALGRAWPFTVTAEPRLASDTRLFFDPERMTVVGLRVPLPASVLRFLARHLSDGFDFSTLPFPLHIAQFEAHDGAITVTGTADVMASLNDRLAATRQ